jgi:hypothetical protein
MKNDWKWNNKIFDKSRIWWGISPKMWNHIFTYDLKIRQKLHWYKQLSISRFSLLNIIQNTGFHYDIFIIEGILRGGIKIPDLVENNV